MEVKGCIDEIRFRNEENGFTIAVVDYDGDPLACVGTFPPLSEGEFVCLRGTMVTHPKFGRQLKVESVECIAPDTPDGIIRYLGSGLIKGVGPKTAFAIVNEFGQKTFDVIEKTPLKLTRIKGLTAARAEEIGRAYGEIKQMRDAVMFLQDQGIGLGSCIKIFKQYGEKTVALVKSNPYRLIEDIDGIGFLTADRLAARLGIGETSEFRLRAGLMHTLKESGERNGNTFLPRDELVRESARLLACDEAFFPSVIDGLVFERKLKNVLTDETEGVMLTSTFRAEMGAAAGLVKLYLEADSVYEDCSGDIDEFERREGISFHEQQRQAIAAAAGSGVAVITGGPGTGKTTIIKCILSVFDNRRKKCLLTAPTGRAAKRLGESTGREASTIHRALMLTRDNRGSDEPVTADVVIVDEFSMVDVFLLSSLCQRLRQGTRLILVGDKDQLPSVGAGNALADILACGFIPKVCLTQIYRQAGSSLIVTNAHEINSGNMPELGDKTGDFFFSRADTAEKIAEITRGMAAKRVPEYLGVEPARVQVLCPMKNGAAGAIALNRILQQALNPDGQSAVTQDEYTFKTGDKVMHTANNYNLGWTRMTAGVYESGEGVFNGDMGFIDFIRTGSGEIGVLFEDGRHAVYTPDLRNQLVLAYAITVHKSQGSEYDAVILPLPPGGPMIMTRNLLYTAITRAKKMAVLVGEQFTVKRMVENNYIAKRYSALKGFMLAAKDNLAILSKEETKD